jgi:DNA repair exonuclease SbcCD ATPase subunit
MIDAQDTQTQALPLEQPAKRGRPATGQAMSNADRQRAYRERQKSLRNEMERELHNAEATLRVDEGFSEGLWEELEQARARIRELEGKLELAEAKCDAMGNELAKEKARKKRPTQTKRRYVLQYHVPADNGGEWEDDRTGDYGSKTEAAASCKRMNEMGTGKWRVRERQWV